MAVNLLFTPTRMRNVDPVGALDEIWGGASLLGMYRAVDSEGSRRLEVFAPPEYWNGVNDVRGPAADLARQAATHYFDRNGGSRDIGVDIMRYDGEGNLRARYGFAESPPTENPVPWTTNPGEGRQFLEPQLQAMRDQAAYAERMSEDARLQHETLTGPNANPADEGYGFYDSLNRSQEAYGQLGAMTESYNAVRDAVPPATGAPTPFEITPPETPAAPAVEQPQVDQTTYDVEPGYSEPFLE